MEIYNNLRQIDINSVRSIEPLTCIYINNDKYIFRHLVKVSYSKHNRGTDFTMVPNISNIVSIIDIANGYIEIRANSKLAGKVMDKISKDLKITPSEIMHFGIAEKYLNNLEDFAKDLNNGKFVDVKSIPNLECELDEEKKKCILRILSSIYTSS